ncbi:MAG: protein kinase [Acidobacteria bacterium]|nr:protein kinase [Acidobacteriota bacterium]MBI3425213.1 protein kinase [Acidobacteriota bacterium]
MKYCLRCQRSYPPSQAFCLEDGEPLSLKDLYGLTGRIIADKYEITALAAVGGMSAIYRAHQIGVHRPVAFKILLPNIAVNNADMPYLFAREAQLAGRLSHENIATIYDAGETEDHVAYIVMEWLEGHTLEAELHARRYLSYERIGFLLQQVGAALDAAHEINIIHRDLKPANIMITKRPDGSERVKVFDFGLAKVIADSVDIKVSSALGTPHYASPEQFRTGEEIGPSSDIYTLGAMLYRLLTGRFPFEAANVHELIRSHLLETPPPLSLYRPGIPSEIENLINRTLAKTPHYRPRHASEVAYEFIEAVRDLPDYELGGELLASEENLHINSNPWHSNSGHNSGSNSGGTSGLNAGNSGRRSGSGASSRSGSTRIEPVSFNRPTNSPFDSPSVRRSGNYVYTGAPEANSYDAPAYSPLNSTQELDVPPAIPPPPEPSSKLRRAGLGVLALALLGSLWVGYQFFRTKLTLTEKDTILLADISNATGEDVFDRTLKQALSVQLAQSPFLNMLGDDKVRETLRFMNRKADERLTREVAREIALRLGLKAAIAGQINKLDRHYSITLEALNAQSGEPFAQTLVEADGKDNVIKALGQAAAELRERLGESLSSIQKFNAPIDQATTSSLDALKAYSQGRDQYSLKDNYIEGVALYKRAIELDPNFALAYNGLSIIYMNTGQGELAIEYAGKAYNLRERVSERERLAIAASYFLVNGEVERAIEAQRLTVQTYPRLVAPHVNLSVCLNRLGQLEAAVAETKEAVRLDPTNGTAYQNQADLLVRLGREDEALQVIAAAQAQKLDRLGFRATLFQIGFLKGDGALMQQQLAWVKGKPDEFRSYEWQAQTLAYEGRLREADELYRRAMEGARQRNLTEVVVSLAMQNALRQALGGNTKAAQKLLDEAVTLSPTTFSLYSASKAAPFGPLMLALGGAVQQAEAFDAELVKRQPHNTLANSIWLPLSRAAIALQRNQPDKALELLRTVSNYEAGAFFYPAWLRANALLKLKQGHEAAAEFEKILSLRGYEPTSPMRPLARLGLARAQVLLGDTAASRKSYDEFLGIWKAADADLSVLAAAKKEAAALRE